MQAISTLPVELDYLVQPFVPEIVRAGEWSLLYFAGEFSHAVLKRPAVGDYRVQSEHGGSTAASRPDPATLVAAAQALAAVTALGHEVPDYARVDGVICAGRFLLMELELIEPSLFLEGEPQAAARLAGQLAARLDQLRASSAAAAVFSCHPTGSRSGSRTGSPAPRNIRAVGGPTGPNGSRATPARRFPRRRPTATASTRRSNRRRAATSRPRPELHRNPRRIPHGRHRHRFGCSHRQRHGGGAHGRALKAFAAAAHDFLNKIVLQPRRINGV